MNLEESFLTHHGEVLQKMDSRSKQIKGKSTSGGGGAIKIVKSVPRQTSSIDDTIVALRKAVFNDDGSDKNVCEALGAFMKYDKNGLDLDIAFSPKLSRQELKWAFEICKESMEERYDSSGYGWDDEDKMRELSENGARFLIVREWPEDEGSDKGELVAFAHFRFSVQGEFMDEMIGESCLILWDIHIEEEYQRKGLGKHLLTILELIAMREGMSRVYVPVQLEDDITQAWVDKVCVPRNYAPDTSLVSLINFDSEMEGFQVFCKEMKRPKKPDVAPSTVFALPAAQPAKPEEEQEEEEQDAELKLGEAIEKLRDLFREKHNREPSAEEIAQWEQVLTEAEEQAPTDEEKA